jgi:hypothetical protein
MKWNFGSKSVAFRLRFYKPITCIDESVHTIAAFMAMVSNSGLNNNWHWNNLGFRITLGKIEKCHIFFLQVRKAIHVKNIIN